MAKVDELLEAIDERLLDLISKGGTYKNVRNLAEARAWITNPNQPHGGISDPS